MGATNVSILFPRSFACQGGFQNYKHRAFSPLESFKQQNNKPNPNPLGSFIRLRLCRGAPSPVPSDSSRTSVWATSPIWQTSGAVSREERRPFLNREEKQRWLRMCFFPYVAFEMGKYLKRLHCEVNNILISMDDVPKS